MFYEMPYDLELLPPAIANVLYDFEPLANSFLTAQDRTELTALLKPLGYSTDFCMAGELASLETL